MIKKNKIETVKTARYFSLGEFNENTRNVYFALHGYAQTAESFLQSLKPLLEENTFILAPEALSRFYWKDFSTSPVASWMTKLEREDDIADNLNYLDSLYKELFEKMDLSQIQFSCIGFSQGAATLSRWLFHADIKVNNIFIYAGGIPLDLAYQNVKLFINSKIYFIYGSKDIFINSSELKSLVCLFENMGVKINVFTFEGKHKIDIKALNFIQKKHNQ